MRTETWEQDQSGMIAGALINVREDETVGFSEEVVEEVQLSKEDAVEVDRLALVYYFPYALVSARLTELGWVKGA